jgi:hypothetical protein
VSEPFRVISDEDLRDGIEALLTIDVGDHDLGERGVPVSRHDTVIEGLGLSKFTMIELATDRREQYVLHRLDHMPQVLNVLASLDESSTSLVEEFLDALDLPADRVDWTASEDFWNETRRSYDRDMWLRERPDLRRHS